MAISGFVILMITVSAVVALGSLIFSFIMVWNFFKKKTIGTALLAIFYGIIAIYHIVHSVMMYLAAENPFTLAHKILFIIYVTSLLLSYYFLYVFACRHILKDNDVVKSIVHFVMLAVNGAILGMMAYELILVVPDESLLFVIDPKPEWGISHYVPAPLVMFTLYLTCVIFVEIRLIFRLSLTLLKKEVENEIEKKGLQQILFGILSLFGSVLLTIIISIPNTNNVVFALLYVLRGILTLLGLLLSYIGWILPNWYVNRIRKTTVVSDVTISEDKVSPMIRSDAEEEVIEINEK